MTHSTIWVTPRNTPSTGSAITGMTTGPLPPSDTDRIIAAQREEAARTRRLLLWLLVGLPALGLLVWGLVALAAPHRPPGDAPDISVSSTVDAGPLSMYSACQQLNNATTAQLRDFDEVWPEVADEAGANCSAHPDWTISRAVAPPVTSVS